jgi:peptide subunit release factor 1 (eRF1)
MLDELLGRADLKARIEELEEEKRHLERRAEAETERRSEAARERQEAEAEVNRLEDRIEELEDRVERLSGDGEADVAFRGTEALRGERLAEVCSRLDSFETGPEGALSAMVEAHPPAEVEEALGERSALVRRAAPCLVYVDDAGLVSVALEPPTPPAEFVEWGTAFRLDRSWFLPREPVRVALVRSDLFALGRFDGEEVTLVDDVETDVMNAHSKGGFSQARFERRRDEQVSNHLDRSKDVLRAHAGGGEGEEADDEELVVLGERTVLGEFEDVADHLATVDATGDPEAALREAVREFWTTRLSLL